VAYRQIIDKLGLVLPNRYLVVYLTDYGGILAYRVLGRVNVGYEHFEYGPIPVAYDGHAKGVIPSETKTDSITFPYQPLAPEIRPDMWWYEEPDKLFHVIAKILPPFLRFFLEIPQTIVPITFRTITSDLKKDFGFTRFEIETIFLPRIHYGWVFYNPTNIDLYTWVHFLYGEYLVELIRKPETIFDLMIGRIPAHWVTLTCKKTVGFDEALARTYGLVEPYVAKFYPIEERPKAVAVYGEVFKVRR